MDAYTENLQTLKVLLPAPCLAEVPYLDSGSPEDAAGFVDLNPLFA